MTSPHEEIRHFETVWIPMPDGVRLAAQCTPLEQTVSGEIGALEELMPSGRYRRRARGA